ncbi:hypothetical protein O181_028259 [Austropuccinia psidii MF-1]|uniref:Uncharacterized protein n=1 Tax=Austropuccinia psidii MF-1 TaxID=1389203 RepID=A0A9Q3H3E2_9BASI|nr:hypothetical protein [Austropuccinia psidii MF-1]
MISRAVHVITLVSCLAGSVLSIPHDGNRMDKNQNIDDLFLACEQNFSIMNECQSDFKSAWDEGKIQQFTTEHQFATYNDCKFTWWTDDKNGFSKTSQDDMTTVFSRMDKFCATSSQSGGPKRAVWVGAIDNSHFTFQIDTADRSDKRL